MDLHDVDAIPLSSINTAFKVKEKRQNRALPEKIPVTLGSVENAKCSV